MKNKIFILCMMLLAFLVSCQSPVTNDTSSFEDRLENDRLFEDMENIPIEESKETLEQGSKEEIKSDSTAIPENYIIVSTFFDSIDQLVAFNKNPSLLNTGNANETEYLLNLHRQGTVFSKDYIYVPVIPDVSDYYADGSFFYLCGIEQSPTTIMFVYRLSTAMTDVEQINSEIRIHITWYEEDNTTVLEQQFDTKKDENGYIFNSSSHLLFRQLDEYCYLNVQAPNYPAYFDFLQLFTHVQKVNVNPDAVTE
ncbi:MAG: hypothetical protein IJW40_11450 [Clostridia bacterium]|nr:hypothetical protein [Clostridia bacterium]